MATPIRLLVVEDAPEDAELLIRDIRRGGLDIVPRCVDNRGDFESALDEFDPDLILADYSMPGFGGMLALEITRARHVDAPFIFVSGTIGEERAIEALRQGATDYVLKNNRARVVPAMVRALNEREERRARRHAEDEREESDRRFRLFMRHFPGVAFLEDLDGRVAFINQEGERLLGRPAIDIVRQPLAAWFPHAPVVRQGGDGGTAGGAVQPAAIVHKVPTVDGVRSLLVEKFPIPGAGGATAMYGGIALDVTERIEQEARIARLSRIQAVLSGINSTIIRVHDAQDLYREVCRIAVDHGRFRMAAIVLAAPGAAPPDPAAWAGSEDGFFAATAGTRSRIDGVTWQVLREQAPVIINDIGLQADARARREALQRGYRSLMALPLLQQGEVIGVLNLYAGEVGFFDQDEVKLLRDLAADISYALDHIASEAKLAWVSYYDAMTGLANRQLFFDRLTQMLRTANGERRNLTVMVIDLRRFRNINDTLGRGAGDKLLKAFASRLVDTFGEGAAPARMSADRFAVTIADQRELAMARRIDNWVVDALIEPFVIEGQELRLAVKIGVALFPGDGESAESLFMNAEAALQRAKDTVDTYVFYAPEINAQLARGLHLESRMRQALERHEFSLVYQPKVELQSRRIVGLEALIRWNDPERGTITPHSFIGVLEDTGLIVEVGGWVIAQVAADLARWRSVLAVVPRVAVNVSQVQLRRDDFVATVLAALGSPADPGAGSPPANGGGGAAAIGIDLEITESLVADNAESNVEKLRQLRRAGMQIYMDDFGTGYSSLSQIARLPLDALKIDRAFIMNMAQNEEHMAIVSTIVNLARALHIEVVAEGVETEIQSDLLRALGCSQAQGYLFSHPLPADEMTALLLARQRAGG